MQGFTKIGMVPAVHSSQIQSSRIGIGLEKLDRNLYDPSPCYAPIGELGVKWVRIQSGWCRTEKQKDVYDFEWLDRIVDNLIAQGTQPWIDLCYGNELYTPEANNKAGSVGRPPIHTEQERAAWDRYVIAAVKHFTGRVQLWEIWNEPDGRWCWRPEPNAAEYGVFALRTAKAIKQANPDAKVITGSFCIDLDFLQGYMSRELAELTDYVTYHRYQFDVDTGVIECVKNIRAVLNSFGGSHIGIIQGETGTQSQYGTRGALSHFEWSQRTQAKFLLRKIMVDLMTEVLFTSYFSTVDIFENINDDTGEKTIDWYGFFGLLGERFDENGIPTGEYFKKDAYRSMQVLCSLMSGAKNTWIPVLFQKRPFHNPMLSDDDAARIDSGVLFQGYTLRNNSKAFVYWKASDLTKEAFNGTTSLHFVGCFDQEISLIDLYDGSIYRINEMQRTAESVTLSHVPLKDYPVMVVFGHPTVTE